MRASLMAGFSVLLTLACAIGADTPATLPQDVAADRWIAPPSMQPKLIVLEGGKPVPQAVILSRADINVSLAGGLAETTTILTFKNTTGRVLEGELEFPLPEGAAVSGYGLDVNDVMVDGVPVEKMRARQIFESEVRKGVDPGILEQTRGNNFKTRIYPIPANSTRSVKVKYTHQLSMSTITSGNLISSRWNYNFPLRFGKIAETNITIETLGADKPIVEGLEGLAFVKDGPKMSASKVFRDIELKGSLNVMVPAEPVLQVLIERREKTMTVEELAQAAAGKNEDRGEYYFRIIRPAPTPRPMAALPPISLHRIAIYWDASLSREKADKTAEIELLKSLISMNKNIGVDVVAFSNTRLAPVHFDIKDGDLAALIKHLESMIYDGATDLGSFEIARHIGQLGFPQNEMVVYDAALLFTDGIATLGDALPAKAAVPVFTVSSMPGADYAVLRHIAENSVGGAFLNLQQVAPADAARMMVERGRREVLTLGYDEKEIADVFPRVSVSEYDAFVITGRLLAPEAALTFKNIAGQEGKITLSRADAVSGALISQNWAAQKIAHLSAMPGRNADELLAIGKDFGMVTPNTSLMVLERVEQYIQYGIVPPKTHPKLYDAFVSRVEKEGAEKKKVEAAKIDRVLAMWKTRTAWWDMDYSKVVVKKLDIKKQEGDGAAPMQNQLAAEVPEGTVVARGAAGAVGGALAPRMALPATPPGMAAEKAKEGGQASPAMTIKIKEYDAKAPYIDALKAAKPEQAYNVFIEQRKIFGNSPAFYLDCADFFLKAKQNEIAVRILTDIAELKLESAPLLRIAAYRLMQIGQYGLAIDLFQKAKELRPDEPQSWRDLAQAVAEEALNRVWDQSRPNMPEYRRQRSDLFRALSLYNHVIMNNWDRFPEIEVTALMEANALWEKIQKTDGAAMLKDDGFKNPLDSRLIKNLACDLRIVMTWDADMTDIDLHVLEPTGEEAYYGYHLTQAGGLVSKDFTQGYGPEEYCIKNARPGKYAIKAKYYGSSQQTVSGPVTVQATVITNFGKANETRQSLTLRLADAKESVTIGEVEVK